MIEVKDFMTEKVLSVSPATPLGKAMQVLFSERVSGLPVVDADHKLVGIITEHELITKDTQLHLPTFMRLFNEFELYKNDKSLIKDDLANILKLTVADVMNKHPLTLPLDATLDQAARMFAEHHSVNPIPIIDKDGRVAGILSHYDLLRLYSSSGSAPVANGASENEIDRKVDTFLGAFEKDFIIVTKVRTRYWLIFSLLFAIVGFIVAFAFIVRLVPNP